MLTRNTIISKHDKIELNSSTYPPTHRQTKKLETFFPYTSFLCVEDQTNLLLQLLTIHQMTEISPWGKTWSKGMIISKYLGVENKCVSTYVMAIEGIPPSNSDNM